MNDTYGIQEICAYEVAAFGESDFCSLFTLAEWEGFQYSTDLAYYGDYSVRSAMLVCRILCLRLMVIIYSSVTRLEGCVFVDCVGSYNILNLTRHRALDMFRSSLHAS
jgi:hypothetical protein